MTKIPAYSSQAKHGECPMCYLTMTEALDAIRNGNAREIKGGAVQFTDLQRESSGDASGIPASVVRAAAHGNRRAAAKIKGWGELQIANWASLGAHIRPSEVEA